MKTQRLRNELDSLISMRFTFYLLTILTLGSCTNTVENSSSAIPLNPVEKPHSTKIESPWPTEYTTQGPKPTLDTTEVKKLNQQFAKWQQKEIKANRMYSHDHCSWSWVETHPLKEWGLNWGFPDSSEIPFSYADLNGDKKLDLMVAFTPDQCDGGNGSITIQMQVFIISSRSGYQTQFDINNGLSGWFGKDLDGFEDYDSIGPGIIYGRHMAFLFKDGHCCPGVSCPTIYEWPSRKVLFMGENVK
jgi:hypothetical protein